MGYSMNTWAVVLMEMLEKCFSKNRLYPAIQGTMDSKVKWLDFLTTDFKKPDDVCYVRTFANEIT